jgi:hypothetical protein
MFGDLLEPWIEIQLFPSIFSQMLAIENLKKDLILPLSYFNFTYRLYIAACFWLAILGFNSFVI